MAKFKFGRAFSDSVTQFKIKRTPHGKFTGWGARLALLYSLFIISFFVLTLRLFHLSIVRGEENRELSEGNRIQTRILHAPRGVLFDRQGRPLVRNIPGLRVESTCNQGKSCAMKLIPLTEWQEDKAYVEHDFLRDYLYPEATAHVLGYLGEVTAEELENPYYIYQNYLIGDRLGRAGLEQTMKKKLRGKDGKELIEVDAQGRKVRTLGREDAVPGTDIHLSLDIEMQEATYRAMEGNRGAVVVSKPKTGEIIALVSTPAFDPNEVYRGLSEAAYSALVRDTDKPLFNRAISGVYPPGSTFKMVAAVAGLETGAVTPATTIEDVGILRIGEFSFSNWYFTQYGGTEGLVDVVKALARSNDIFFYKLGEATGVSRVAEWGRMFGLGKTTGIELTGEAEGVMADPVWRERVRGEKWYLGDTYHLAIGQGDLGTTPLQVNLFTNIIASGGVLCQPTLLSQKSRSKADQSLAEQLRTQGCKDLKIKKETIEKVTEGMFRACSTDQGWGYQGTGWPLFDFTVTREVWEGEVGKQEVRRVPTACKTGTAEFGDPDGKTHAWFTAFAPLPTTKQNGEIPVISGEPEIVVTVLVESGGEGSSVAAPIAKKILEEWFRR